MTGVWLMRTRRLKSPKVLRRGPLVSARFRLIRRLVILIKTGERVFALPRISAGRTHPVFQSSHIVWLKPPEG